MPNKLNPMCQIPEELLPPACISLAGNAIDWADDADAHGLAMVPVAPKTLRAMAEQLRRIPELEAELTRWQTELVKSQALVDALRAQGARVPKGWRIKAVDDSGERFEVGHPAIGSCRVSISDYTTPETILAWLVGDILEGLSSAPTALQADSTPLLHVGESRFESWFSEYESKQKGAKQQMRDAYAAGMGDPLVTYATQPTDTPQSAHSVEGAKP
jgi:hypothetical protein